MMKDRAPSQLTEQTIRGAIAALNARTDLPAEARLRGVKALTEALNRLASSYSKTGVRPRRPA